MKKEVLDYGPVIVTKGKYKGKVGYYDDDEGWRAMVYFGGSLMSGTCVAIDPSYLKQHHEYAVDEYCGKKLPKREQFVAKNQSK